MVEIVLGIAVFVLAVAMVGLFAMMGELSSRVRDAVDPPEISDADHPPHAISEARIGARPDEWPAELAAVGDADVGYLFVFGSTCASCVRIASGATGSLTVLGEPLAIVVSCPLPADGANFVASHPLLQEHPYMIDVGGTWVSRTFSVGISPSVLVFARGRLQSAHTFVAATALTQLADAHDMHDHPHAVDVKAIPTARSPLARDRS